LSCFFVVGTDKRSLNIKEMLKNEGKMAENMDKATYIIAPTPFSKDSEVLTGTDMKCKAFVNICIGKIVFAGAIPKEIKEMMEEKNIKYYDLMEYDDVAILNAIPTAEGAIKIAIEKTETTLSGSKVLVMGYGRIGKILCKMLHGIGAEVYCEARKASDLAQIKALGYNDIDLKYLDNYLQSFEYIFNTIPKMILDRNRLEKVKKDVCIIDLASNPGGVDFEAAKEKNIQASLELALPSKVAPISAAMYLKKKIDEIIQDEIIGG